MKSFFQWRLNEIAMPAPGFDPAWQAKKWHWGDSQPSPTSPLFSKFRLKIEALKQDFAAQRHVKRFDDIPVTEIDKFAKDVVATVLKVIYGEAAPKTPTAQVLKPTADHMQSTMPQNQINAPDNWKG